MTDKAGNETATTKIKISIIRETNIGMTEYCETFYREISDAELADAFISLSRRFCKDES